MRLTRRRPGCSPNTSRSTPARSRSSPNGLGNIPTIKSALSDPTLTSNPQFDTFLKIFANPHTQTDPNTAIGQANQEMLQSWQSKWEDGSVPESGLASGLKSVDQQIDAQVANSTAGQGAP